MKTFTIKSLGKYARFIETLEFNDGTMREEIMGYCWLKPKYELDDSSMFSFTSKKDLMNLLKELEVKYE